MKGKDLRGRGRLSKRFWLGWGGAVLGAALVVGLVLLPPFVSEGFRAALMQAFSGVCHQITERSPHLHGVALAVCDRCFGIYSALLLGALLYPLFLRWDELLGQHAGVVLLASGLPAAIDWAGDVVGLWMNTPASRFITGSLFGLVAGIYLARALARAVAPQKAPASSTA